MKFSANDFELIKEITIDAGQIIKDTKNKRFSLKQDKSPVTLADLKSNKLICKRLKENFPYIPIISEELKKKLFQILFF